MHTIADIENILKQKHLVYNQISSSMYSFSVRSHPDTIIGYVSISYDNNILCRFYYKTVELSHTNTFLYDESLFDREIKYAESNFIKLHNKKINDVLDSI